MRRGWHASRIVWRAGCIAAVLCCAATAAFAATNPPQQVQVVGVAASGDLLLSDGTQAVLANLVMPNAALAAPWLKAHALQQRVRVDENAQDRYGRRVVGGDVQEDMLREGVAVLYASGGEIPPAWRVAEAAARAAKRGLWAADGFVLTPENAAQHGKGFHVVEGRITRIYEGKQATYLNFGEDWHSDFSITISAKARRSMKPLLQSLQPGDWVRVRGGLYEENGPMLRLLHAENLEKR